jgi:Ca2+-binding RTX toxin-like protein
LDYRAFSAPVTVNLQRGTAPAIGGFSNITNVLGGKSGEDTLIGRDQTTTWNLTGFNAGHIAGTPFQSAFYFSGFENLAGGAAPDTFTIFNAGGVSGAVDGGSGFTLADGTPSIDTLDYSRRSTGVVVDLTRGLIPGVGLAVDTERVIGTPKDDLLRGDGRDNILHGGGGFDILVGLDGNDTLIAGNTGSCILIGGRGVDKLMGGNPSSDPQTGKPIFDGSDLLIGGLTSYDEHDEALIALMNAWRGRGRSYLERVEDLRTGVLTDTVEVVQLTTATVFDDGDADRIAGLGGDDWFWGLAAEVADRSQQTSQSVKLEFLN